MEEFKEGDASPIGGLPLRTYAPADRRSAAADDGRSPHRVPAHDRERLFVERGHSGGKAIRSSAASTALGIRMSWLFTRGEGFDEFVNVRATMFDDTSWFAPFVDICAAEKLSWATTSAERGSEASFPTGTSAGFPSGRVPNI